MHFDSMVEIHRRSTKEVVTCRNLTVELLERISKLKYELTLFFSGHRSYRVYLNRLGHDDSPYYQRCVNTDDNVDHVVNIK